MRVPDMPSAGAQAGVQLGARIVRWSLVQHGRDRSTQRLQPVEAVGLGGG